MRNGFGDPQPLRIDVIKADDTAAEIGFRQDVAQQVLGEHRAARTDEDDAWAFAIDPARRFMSFGSRTKV